MYADSDGKCHSVIEHVVDRFANLEDAKVAFEKAWEAGFFVLRLYNIDTREQYRSCGRM